MDIPPPAVEAADTVGTLIVTGRAGASSAVDQLIAAIRVDPQALASADLLAGTYFAAEPQAVALIAAAQRRCAEQAIAAAVRAAGGWAGTQIATSTIPDLPDGLLTPPAQLATVLRQTVLVETQHRLRTGVDPTIALEHARLRGGRATAGIVADTTRAGYTGRLQSAGLGWARQPSTAACPFCLLMASRGPVYHSKQTAQGKRGYYHPWDRCTPLAVPRGTQPGDYLDGDVADLVRQADADYQAGRLTLNRSAPRGGGATTLTRVDPQRAREMAAQLEASARAMDDNGMPDAAAKARARATQLRAQAADGTIPTPRAGGSGSSSGGGGSGRPGSGDASGGGPGGGALLRPLDTAFEGLGYEVQVVRRRAGGSAQLPAPYGRQTKNELEVAGRVGKGLEYLVTEEEQLFAELLAGAQIRVRSVNPVGGGLHKPDFVFVDADETMEFKSVTGDARRFRARIMDGRNQSSRIVADASASKIGDDHLRLLLLSVIDRYGTDLEEVVVIGRKRVYRWEGGAG